MKWDRGMRNIHIFSEWYFTLTILAMYRTWQDIKAISKYRLSISLQMQNKMLSSWVWKKDLLVKRHKLTCLKMTDSITSVLSTSQTNSTGWSLQQNSTGKQSCSHQTSENSKDDNNQTTLSAVSHCKQNPFKSLMTAGHSSAIHIHHHKGCQKVKTQQCYHDLKNQDLLIRAYYIY